MTEAPNNGGSGEVQGTGTRPPTASQLGAGANNAPATGADSAALQGANPGGPDDTDAESRRIAAKEKREGIKKGTADALEALGFDSLEAAQSWVSEYRTIEQEMESEADREKSRADKAEGERDDYRSRYETTERRYALRDALRDAGVPGDRLSDALALANLDDISLDRKTGEVSGVSEVVETLLQPRPWLLETNEQAQRVSAPATHTTTAPRRQDGSGQGSGDPETDMGRAALDWLIAPTDQGSNTWP